MFLVLLLLFEFLVHQELKTVVIEPSIEQNANEVIGVLEGVVFMTLLSIEDIDVELVKSLIHI